MPGQNVIGGEHRALGPLHAAERAAGGNFVLEPVETHRGRRGSIPALPRGPPLRQNRSMSLPRIALLTGLLLLAAPGLARAEDPASPRLNALRKEIATSEPAALERFWRRLAGEGTPLVEPVEGEENESLVAFVWRGGGAAGKGPVVGLPAHPAG